MAGSLSPARHMRWITASALLAAVSTATPAAAKNEPPHSYGPAPSWDEFRTLAEARIRSMLVDPDSAKISWTHGFRQGGYQPMLSPKIHGYTTCGYVNARNRMGGYTGTSMFMVVIDHGRVLYSELGKPSGDMMSDRCAKGMREGIFPMLPDDVVLAEEDKAAAAAGNTGFDFTTSIVPDGAYVKAVTAGGLAEQAGLKPGMVLTELNGIPIRELDAATVNRLLSRVQGEAAFTVIGVGAVKLRKPAPQPVATSSSANVLPTNIVGLE